MSNNTKEHTLYFKYCELHSIYYIKKSLNISYDGLSKIYKELNVKNYKLHAVKH